MPKVIKIEVTKTIVLKKDILLPCTGDYQHDAIMSCSPEARDAWAQMVAAQDTRPYKKPSSGGCKIDVSVDSHIVSQFEARRLEQKANAKINDYSDVEDEED